MELCYKAIELREKGSHTVHCISRKEGAEVPRHLLGIRAKLVSPGFSRLSKLSKLSKPSEYENRVQYMLQMLGNASCNNGSKGLNGKHCHRVNLNQVVLSPRLSYLPIDSVIDSVT